MSLFTPEELAELQRFDSELDAEFRQTQEEIEESRKRDRRVGFERKDNRGRKIAAQKAAYREANKEKIAAQKAAYREANKEKIADYQAAYREANRGEYNAYMREYMRQYRAKKKAASGVRDRKAANSNGSGLV